MPVSPESDPVARAPIASSPKKETSSARRHPSALSLSNLVVLVVLSVVGAIIGVELLVTLGVSLNTSLIGALVAMTCGRVPLRFFCRYRSIHAQNLAQTSVSAATFGAANCLLLPIAITFVFGRPDLMLPMLSGVASGMLLDGYMLYRLFGSTLFPASGSWPLGIATAGTIKAGDEGGKHAWMLGAGLGSGAIGSYLGVPMAAFGTAFMGNIWALSVLGIGFLIGGYAGPLFDFAIAKTYAPHGMMIGGGVVALIQVGIIAWRERRDTPAGTTLKTAGARPSSTSDQTTYSKSSIGTSLRLGAVGYLVIAALVAAASGLYADMSTGMLIAFIFYAAFAAFVHELIVGIAAMHSGWFPAFAVALITLLLGMMLGFPPVSLVILCGFSVATGPAFADMGYDLKAGFILRGHGADRAFELEGRRQQLIAAMIGFVIAIPVVYLTHAGFFANDQVPPTARAFVTTINAGLVPGMAKSLMIWAVVGAFVQWLGGPKRQLGLMLSTGLLIANPLAGCALTVGIAFRLLIQRRGPAASSAMETFAAGAIAGDALFNFSNAVIRSRAQ